MSLIVQKFGGTSVADSEKILAAARKAVRAYQEGNQVAVVVSAMGKNTDLLIDLARQINENPPAREMDMLLSTGEQVSVALMAMAVEALGYRAISLAGAQIGIRTDSIHTKARIQSISTERMRQALDAGQIVIVAGFQGIDEQNNITTLGRGGSDTTAVAIAAVLEAKSCEIYTDVDGVYTTDPRVLPEARKVEQISYDEMLELASLGAGVLHNRSVEFAKKFSVPLVVRSSFSDAAGTLVGPDPEAESRPVSGCALEKNQALVTLLGVPDEPGTSLKVFSQIASHNVTVDMIVQNVGAEGKANISFTIMRDDLAATFQAVQELATTFDGIDVSHNDGISKVSAVGIGMARQTGVAQAMFQALADAGINILAISTSEIKISVLVSRSQAVQALRAIHSVFELDREPPQPKVVHVMEPPTFSEAEKVEVVSRLRTSMEALVVNEVSLDESQARVTINAVPDSPGLAAGVFADIAEAGILVDMIVQDAGIQQQATLSFTVPREDLRRTIDVAEQLSQKLACGPVTSSPEIAKLSVEGIGLRSNAEVAIRVFRALSEAGINLQMIFTSEVRVSVLVSGEDGKRAQETLKQAFELA